MKLLMTKDKISNGIVWILTTILLCSFLIANLSTLGSAIMLFITMTIAVVSGVQHGVKFKFVKMHLFVFLFGLYCLISSLWAWNPTYAIEKGITIFQILIYISVLYMHYSNNGSIDSLLKSIMWSGVIVSLYYFVTEGISNIVIAIIMSSRAGSTFANINNVAMLAAYSIVIAVSFALYNKKYIQLIAVTAICIIVIAASGSRKAIIALIVGMVLLFVKKNMSKQIIVTSLKIAILLVVAYFSIQALANTQLFSGVAARMESMMSIFTGGGTEDYSTRMRQYFIEIGLNQFVQTPVFGNGIGNPRILAAQFTGHNAYLHNNYVELLAGGGIIGFLLYYVMFAYIGRKLFRYRHVGDHSGDVLMIMLVIMLVLDYGAVSYYFKDTYFYVMVCFVYINRLSKAKIYVDMNKLAVGNASAGSI